MDVVVGGYYKVGSTLSGEKPNVWKVSGVGTDSIHYEVYAMNGIPTRFQSNTSLKWFKRHVICRVIPKRKIT